MVPAPRPARIDPACGSPAGRSARYGTTTRLACSRAVQDDNAAYPQKYLLRQVPGELGLVAGTIQIPTKPVLVEGEERRGVGHRFHSPSPSGEIRSNSGTAAFIDTRRVHYTRGVTLRFNRTDNLIENAYWKALKEWCRRSAKNADPFELEISPNESAKQGGESVISVRRSPTAGRGGLSFSRISLNR